MNKITAIYVRRSVSDKEKDNNSLSIEAQKEECVKYLGEGENYRIYCDDGKSGKDIEHRPAFQEMMGDARNGLIDKIIVKKYDRFSRNMREYLNVTNQLDKYGVGVISLSEPFNTETKEGRMMRNNLLNFAEFERETIAARVADAYNTKARETGFYQGGKVYFGYKSSRQTINGKKGSVLVPSEQAFVVQKAYEIYQQPCISLKDVVDYLRSMNINAIYADRKNNHGNLDRSHISRILESPLYVRADKEVYRYLAAQGFEILDDISAYDGIHGLFLHGKYHSSNKPYVKVGYHVGLVNAETWLAVQDKKVHNFKFHGKKKAVNSWLVGLVKCAHCGYALTIQHSQNTDGTKVRRYYVDTGHYTVDSCIKRTLMIRPDDVENAVFKSIKERISSLEIAKREINKPNPNTEKITAEIIRTDDEICKLMGKLANANDTLFEYIQRRIGELHREKAELENKLHRLSRCRKVIDTSPLNEPLSKWDELTTQDKRDIAGKVIEVIHVSDETGIDIKFSI